MLLKGLMSLEELNLKYMDKLMSNNMKILDVAYGSRMFYFDKSDPRVTFCDIRSESHTLCDGRALEIKPDIIADFRNLPFNSESFNLVVFDPPHLHKVGKNSWLAKKYGALSKENWKDDIRQGFSECLRVLKKGGTLVFKWNETDIPTKTIISLSPIPPVFGHPSGRRAQTHWMTFLKVE